jgi:hypothetical protein
LLPPIIVQTASEAELAEHSKIESELRRWRGRRGERESNGSDGTVDLCGS